MTIVPSNCLDEGSGKLIAAVTLSGPSCLPLKLTGLEQTSSSFGECKFNQTSISSIKKNKKIAI